jgi:hypothetical protein
MVRIPNCIFIPLTSTLMKEAAYSSKISVSAFKTRQCKNPKGHIAMKTQNLKCLPFICASYRIVCQTSIEKLKQIITLIF